VDKIAAADRLSVGGVGGAMSGAEIHNCSKTLLFNATIHWKAKVKSKK